MTSQRGELIRERRRQCGLPIADRVLPFRSKPPEFTQNLPLASEDNSDDASATLEAAELRGAKRRSLVRLEEVFHAEVAAMTHIAATHAPTSTYGAS